MLRADLYRGSSVYGEPPVVSGCTSLSSRENCRMAGGLDASMTTALVFLGATTW